jgi:tetratricopeptide (TPR) repeat protein
LLTFSATSKTKPGNTFSLYYRADLYYIQEKLKAAIDDMDRAISIDPDNPDLYFL